jgi:hypothetical protein
MVNGGEVKKHRWQFCRLGGVDQVVLRDGADLAHLRELDLKLWMALCMPTRGIAIDPRTADLLDTDKDGSIRPPELLAALAWCEYVFVDLGVLLKRSDAVELTLRSRMRCCRRGRAACCIILANRMRRWLRWRMFRAANVSLQIRVLTGMVILPPSSAKDPEIESAIADILKVCEGKTDRSGKPGIADGYAGCLFAAGYRLCLAWLAKPDVDEI